MFVCVYLLSVGAIVYVTVGYIRFNVMC